jgi:hypothetical protein
LMRRVSSPEGELCFMLIDPGEYLPDLRWQP